MALRRCDFCREPLPEGKRSDARYCDGGCRARASLARQGKAQRGAKAKRGGHPENGTRVYLLPEDFDGLLYDTNYLLDSTLAKIERAAWRVGLASDGRTPLAGATEREQRRAREGLSGRASPPAS